eukprot:CAMPEP_0172359628 /NCGR_PEP_ID=MMETSP1060-20121228/3818_1 /TAXON_ID=37318 /ORGANISM="Pseudo-nitzschia pungens, Strain cf. cingulata" /LENGTH=732 /DNA_ID=CAMNT_0013081379 /DNA_START=138 /DNA_END=2336 /DNA_ORIENTATION=-
MLVLKENSSLRSVLLSLDFYGSSGSRKVAMAVLLPAAAGILLSGYLCFAFGAVVAFEATRATVRILGGYRWEWMRFLKGEIHRSYRISRIVPNTRARAVAVRHPLTGEIDGYRVEYAYRCPSGSDNGSDNNDNDNDNDNDMDARQRQQRPTHWMDFHRKIMYSYGNNGGSCPDPSVSYYQKEAVRSIAEYIQRESGPDDDDDDQRRMYGESDESGSDDDESISGNDESISGSSDEIRRTTDNHAPKTANTAEDEDPNFVSGHPQTHRTSSLPSARQPPIESFLVPIDRRNPFNNNNKANLELGVPLGYWMERRRELLAWAEIVEPGIAFFGTNFYLLGSLIHALQTCHSRTAKSNHNGDGDSDACFHHVKSSFHLAVAAIILMIPYCVVEARSVHRKRMQFWRRGGDPLSSAGGISELERLRNVFRSVMRFGRESFPSVDRYNDNELDYSWKHYARKESLYAPSFVLGTLLLYWECGPTTLVWGYGAVYCMAKWIHDTAPIQRQTLEGFKYDQHVLSNVPAAATAMSDAKYTKGIRREGWLHRLIAFVDSEAGNNKVVRLRYVVSVDQRRTRHKSGSTEMDPETIVEKYIQSEALYRQCKANPASTCIVSMHIDPYFPLSGYPTSKLDRDISNSWSLKQWRVACFCTIWCFLFCACTAIAMDDDDYIRNNPFPAEERGVEDLIMGAILILLGFGLLLPGVSTLRQIEHDRFLRNVLYEPKGSVVQADARQGE